ncbi:hypothetical protein ZWY2020_027051 [Hordeum vulgare]|nr:hypothetical protein ZWY2020_027051 [Hordeum vulgare]
MADTARTRAASPPPHQGLPEEIAIWEILVRLPPKSLLRCRAVCRAWRRATSARDFLLAHHARQPTLPLLNDLNFVTYGGHSLDTIPLDLDNHQGSTDRLHPVVRFREAYVRLFASCDGLLLLSMARGHLVLCNPATRQLARLPIPAGFIPLGMYPHGPSPTAEYRLLLYLFSSERVPDDQAGSYILTAGSGHLPRHIGCSDVERLIFTSGSVMFHGSLHWYHRNEITVFDTTTELFREMRAPVDAGPANLFEMDGMLAASIFNDPTTSIDIWMVHDYDTEVWTFKCRVSLPVTELTAQFGIINRRCCVVFASWDGDVLVLAKFGDWLLQVDRDGKLVATFRRRGIGPTQNRLKQSLVQHTFFPTLEGYVVNASPFI